MKAGISLTLPPIKGNGVKNNGMLTHCRVGSAKDCARGNLLSAK